MKRAIACILLVALLATALYACAQTPAEQPAYIGIVSAMDNEIEVLLQAATIERTDTIGGIEYHVGTLLGHHVVIGKSGIGKVRASAGVTAMLNNYNISKLIFTGIAGGVNDDAEVLDEIIATRLVEHDYGLITNDGFVWSSGDSGTGIHPGNYYDCDKDLVDLAYTAAVDVLGSEHVFKGIIATGDQFIASESYVQRLQDDYDAHACEMEGASVAVVCLEYGKPYVVIRCLSDKADGLAHESYTGFGDEAADRSSKIVLKMLEKIED